MMKVSGRQRLMDQLGQSVTVHPPDGDPFVVEAMVDPEETRIETEDHGRDALASRSITVGTQDSGGVPLIGEGYLIEFDGLRWRVDEVVKRSGALVTVRCVRDSAVERTRRRHRRD